MKRLLIVLTLFGALPSARAAELDTKALDAIVEKARKEFDVPGAAVAVVKDGGVVYLKGFGNRSAGSADAVTPDSLFAIASNSKAFCATLIAMRIDDGKMKWDDAVRRHVPFFRLSDPLADRDVTVRDLLCHRTGLSRHDMLRYRAPWDDAEKIRRMADLKPNTSFRSTWEYNNLAFMAAGYAAASIDGSTYAALLKKRIFKPLGMRTATGSAREAEQGPDHATPHLAKRRGEVTGIPRYMQEVDGAGGINASARDLSRWVRFQLGDGTWEGKRLVSAAGLKEMHTAQMVIARPTPSARAAYPPDVTNNHSYGLAWGVQDYRGHSLVTHGGSIDGFRSRIALLPKDKFGIVALCNLGSTMFPEAVCNALSDHLLGLPPYDWNGPLRKEVERLESFRRGEVEQLARERKPGTKPTHKLEDYAGAYQAPAYGEVKVTSEKDGLVLRWSSFTLKMKHYHVDSFTFRDVPVELETSFLAEVVAFHLDDSGKVAGLTFLKQDFKR